MSNYPAGAWEDPSAPWWADLNECRECGGHLRVRRLWGEEEWYCPNCEESEEEEEDADVSTL